MMTQTIKLGWVKSDKARTWGPQTIAEATAYELNEQGPIPRGTCCIDQCEEGYTITAYNFGTGSWDVAKSELEKGLPVAKEKAEAIFRRLI